MSKRKDLKIINNNYFSLIKLNLNTNLKFCRVNFEYAGMYKTGGS